MATPVPSVNVLSRVRCKLSRRRSLCVLPPPSFCFLSFSWSSRSAEPSVFLSFFPTRDWLADLFVSTVFCQLQLSFQLEYSVYLVRHNPSHNLLTYSQYPAGPSVMRVKQIWTYVPVPAKLKLLVSCNQCYTGHTATVALRSALLLATRPNFTTLSSSIY